MFFCKIKGIIIKISMFHRALCYCLLKVLYLYADSQNKGGKIMGCIFCDIINGKLPSTKEYEDNMILAFRDINPKTPVHVVIVSKTHIRSARCINESNSSVVARVFETVPKLAEKLSLKNGFRVMTNCESDGAQTVDHLHFHLLGGIAMSDDVGLLLPNVQVNE